MATESAYSPSRLWQLPAFGLGLAALIALWQAGDRLRPTLSERYEKALLVLRPAVDRVPADEDRIRAALRRLPDAEPPPDLAAKVKYLRGSAYVSLAETVSSPTEAAEWWARAQKDLEAAADHELPAADQRKLRFRLARVWAHVPGSDPERIIDGLTKNAGCGDDPSEAYRLLSELHRQSTPPNESAERESLQNFLRHAAPRSDARTLNGARVRLGELHAKFGAPEDAKKVLERVGADAPPELFAAARLRMGALAASADDWTKAAAEWEQVRGLKSATAAQQAEAVMHLAETYVKLGRGHEAQALVKDVGRSDSPESRAITFRQAEAALQDPKTDKETAIELLERAFAGAERAALQKAIPATDARRVCELAFKKATAAKDFTLALRVGNAYARIALNDDQQRMLADAYLGQAETAVADVEALGHYRSAAKACRAAAAVEANAVTRIDWLRKAAKAFAKAGERPEAIAALDEIAGRMGDYPPERSGPVWTEIGDAYMAAGESARARDALQRASTGGGPDKDRAAIQLASFTFEADPEKGGTAAIKMLHDILNQKPAVDLHIRGEARFLLGEIHLLRKEWEEAERSLKEALETHAEHARSIRGRYHLGQVMRHGAYEAAHKIKTDRITLEEIRTERLRTRQANFKVVEETRLVDRIERSQKTYEDMMRRAFEEFRKAEEALLATPDTADAGVLRRSAFWVADCAYWLGDFADAAARCDKLAVRYRGRVEELEALRDLHRCCTFAEAVAREAQDKGAVATWSQRAADSVRKLRSALATMPVEQFDGTAETRAKSYWDNWLTRNTPAASARE